MSLLGYGLYLAWGAAIFTIIYGLGQIIIRRRSIKERFLQPEKDEQIGQVYYRLLSRSEFHRFRDFIEEKAEFAGKDWTLRTYLIYSFIAASIGGGFAVVYLKNIAAAFPLGIVFWLTPLLYLNHTAARKQAMMEKQFLPAVQKFITEYGTINNITSVILSIEGQIASPLKDEFARLGRELNSGAPADKTFLSFARRLNNPWAYRFAHILNLRVTRGVEITPMLFSLLMDMKTNVIKEKERSMEMVGVKAETYAIYLAIPLMYSFTSKVNPNAHYLLTQTSEGKRAMFIVILILLIGFVSTLWLNDNKIKD